MKTNVTELKMEAACDQLWSLLKDRTADIERLSAHGPDGSAEDHELVILLALVVYGELQRRRHYDQQVEAELRVYEG